MPGFTCRHAHLDKNGVNKYITLLECYRQLPPLNVTTPVPATGSPGPSSQSGTWAHVDLDGRSGSIQELAAADDDGRRQRAAHLRRLEGWRLLAEGQVLARRGITGPRGPAAALPL